MAHHIYAFTARRALWVVSAALIAAGAGPAMAQSNGSGTAGQFQAGYGGARYTTASPQRYGMRDENGNLLVVNGLIQAGASAYSNTSGGAGVSGGRWGINSSTAIGNNLNVVVQGNWNTVIVNSTQINNGNVTAGRELNGSVNID
ncbi:MAG: holdfast anchoring protein HfaA [Brevundimonas sp.]|jgi:holdfast attachment protein HfaA|uniref:holdfast anchoring protein HfaA n=1 Tax=Brevundimonas sp. TaxID=1871086 RepID=UPI00391B8CB8